LADLFGKPLLALAIILGAVAFAILVLFAIVFLVRGLAWIAGNKKPLKVEPLFYQKPEPTPSPQQEASPEPPKQKPRTNPKEARRSESFRSAETCAARLQQYVAVLPPRTPFERRTWSSLFESIVRREVTPEREILVSELDAIQRSGGLPVDLRLQHRRAAIMNNLADYPIAAPKAPSIAAPEMPILITAADISDCMTKYLIDETDRSAVEVDAEQYNLRVEQAFLAARRIYETVIAEAQAQHEKSLAIWREHKRQWQQERLAELRDIDQCLKDFKSAGDIEFLTELIIASSKLPRWVPHNTAALYDKENGVLIVELQFPNVEDITFLKQVEMKRGIESKSVNQKEHKLAVSKFYPLLALRVATDLAQKLSEDQVEFIAVNGWVDYRSKSTGILQRAYCASLGAKTADLRVIEIEHVDPVAAFSSLKGNSSRSAEITPIAPTVRIDLNDPRYIDNKEVLRKMEAGENLAAMDWEDFEHLCRELFERVFAAKGATVKVTQASRDQGVDAVIHDPDPIMGGRIVIQAKRYVNVVDVSAVRDLAGTVAHEGAMKGLLITTSHFGPEAYAFAQGKPLQLINGAELLGLLEKHGYKFRIDLDEARRLQKELGAFGFRNAKR
jgi:hypothetical protein